VIRTPAATLARGEPPTAKDIDSVPAQLAGALPAAEVLARLRTDPTAGLSSTEAADRLDRIGPNALRDHRARVMTVLARQLKSALLALLFVTATVSFALGEHTDAVIIGLILAASVGLGFVNEYRAERATEALHSNVHHLVVTIRDGQPTSIDVVDLVPGDIVHLALGEVVPADIRLLATTGLECDESVLTGESVPREKSPSDVSGGLALADLDDIALMGTVVRAGNAVGVVVATATDTEFGRIASGLGDRQPETDFQVGLRRFSLLLMQVALVLSAGIFVTNIVLDRSIIDSLLFSLAIAVGITPQLLPAVVSISLATGSRQLARRKVLVKRLVCIEDLGDMDILVTDKTGTLTEGRTIYSAALDTGGQPDEQVRLFGLLASDVERAGSRVVGGNPLDVALAEADDGTTGNGWRRLGALPFDHERRLSSVIVADPAGASWLITKGAPESVLAICPDTSPSAQATLDELFAAGRRVIAVARKSTTATTPTTADEQGLELMGFLVFLDPPKPGAAQSLRRLSDLGIKVKVATGDNPRVAQKLCADLGWGEVRVMTGTEIDGLDEAALSEAAEQTDVFARISPEHKARIIRALRKRGRAVGFLGDGVNDALALHEADIGISVDTATDVAKDAADVVLLETSLDVLADGVAEGRRIFANTIKYVLMGTSSNFGNMFSAAAASALLTFLPMLPSQILLNNLLYDTSQLTIPTDHVDEEQLAAPSHWNIAFIRRFMLIFGPISSLFDFATFGVMLGPLHANAELFRSGWFIESLATQTLIIFAIRTRRVPFLRSRPSWQLTVAALSVVAVGIALPMSPLAGPLGFNGPPLVFYAVLAAMVGAYLILIEVAKKRFYAPHVPATTRRRGTSHLIHRRAARFSAR